MLLLSQEQGADRLVLDIRNNGGGLFPAGAFTRSHPKTRTGTFTQPSAACAFAVVIHTGVQVARSLINSGDIVLIADANGVRDIYSANGGALDSSTPMSVLVNKGTASASEVG